MSNKEYTPLPHLDCPICKFTLSSILSSGQKKKGRKKKSLSFNAEAYPENEIKLKDSANLYFITYSNAILSVLQTALSDESNSATINSILEQLSQLFYFDELNKEYVHPSLDDEHFKYLIRNHPKLCCQYAIEEEYVVKI